MSDSTDDQTRPGNLKLGIKGQLRNFTIILALPHYVTISELAKSRGKVTTACRFSEDFVPPDGVQVTRITLYIGTMRDTTNTLLELLISIYQYSSIDIVAKEVESVQTENFVVMCGAVPAMVRSVSLYSTCSSGNVTVIGRSIKAVVRDDQNAPYRYIELYAVSNKFFCWPMKPRKFKRLDISMLPSSATLMQRKLAIAQEEEELQVSVLRGLQRLVSDVQKRGEQFAIPGLQQVRQAGEEPRPAGVLQFHQVQSARGHKPPQQPGERGHGRDGPVRGVEETVAGDEGQQEHAVADRQHKGDRSHDAPLPASKLEAAPSREDLRVAETTREPSVRGEQVLSRALGSPIKTASHSHLREHLRSDCQILRMNVIDMKSVEKVEDGKRTYLSVYESLKCRFSVVLCDMVRAVTMQPFVAELNIVQLFTFRLQCGPIYACTWERD
ncbi:hypothetical protein WN51_00881 [Melipona quadrifasciata]|uniref:Uncharacterized protein n=1 Tax=Melipona quadrifasciata TaxID=166423 RepID=A0A0M9ADC8_9HYME|nr:hypothetical protein WN51_00881 [Melipona quadrifasciata]